MDIERQVKRLRFYVWVLFGLLAFNVLAVVYNANRSLYRDKMIIGGCQNMAKDMINMAELLNDWSAQTEERLAILEGEEWTGKSSTQD